MVCQLEARSLRTSQQGHVKDLARSRHITEVTQLGHVKDLASAFVKALGNEKAFGEIYNISGPRCVSFDGIAKACAKAAGAPEPELVHFDAKDFDFGKSKAFPLRDQHFFTSIDKAMADLDWTPEFSLLDGLKDSYSKDFGDGKKQGEQWQSAHKGTGAS
eukprot:gene13672-19560_t